LDAPYLLFTLPAILGMSSRKLDTVNPVGLCD
jgi:hypothetical protein